MGGYATWVCNPRIAQNSELCEKKKRKKAREGEGRKNTFEDALLYRDSSFFFFSCYSLCSNHEDFFESRWIYT